MATTLTPSAKRIAELFDSVDVADVMAGIEWYGEARDIAGILAERYGVTVAQAAGVIAATSPLNSWGANVQLAERILATRDFTSGYIRLGLGKCERILAGEDIATVLNGAKITNFWESIMSAGESGVCIDRHAFDIAVGVRHTDETRPGIGVRLYAACAEAYVQAAEMVSREGVTFTPAEVQSVTWVEWRKNFWRAGAWDGGAAVA